MSRWPTPIRWRATAYETPDGLGCIARSSHGRWIVAVRDQPIAQRATEGAALRLAERMLRRLASASR